MLSHFRTLSALLSTKSEKVASMLMISYTAATSLRFGIYSHSHFKCLITILPYRRDLLADYASFPTIGLEEYQVRVICLLVSL